MHTFLESVAHGQVPDHDATAVFNDLIAHEAYEVFADAFNSYNNSLKSLPDNAGKPFKACLKLQLPQGWAPTAPQAMQAAFERTSVQRLEVLPPPAAPQVQAANDDSAWTFFDGDGGSRPNALIPSAACNMVKVLLTKPSGVSELSIQGVMEDAPTVVLAVSNSTSIESLELGDPLIHGHRPTEEAMQHGKFFANVATCTKLKNLSVPDMKSLAYINMRMREDPQRMPSLTSLTLNSISTIQSSISTEFLKILKETPQLDEVTLTIRTGHANVALKQLLPTLKDQPSLTRLKASHEAGIQPTLEGADFMPQVFQLLKDRPAPTQQLEFHYRPRPDLLASESMNLLYKNEGVDKLQERSAVIEDTLKSASCPLQKLSATGLPMLPGHQRSLFAGIADNTSLEELDLSHSCIDIEALDILAESLKRNPHISVTLPTYAGKYYMLGSDGVFYGFRQGLQASGNRDDFQLKRSEASKDKATFEAMKHLFGSKFKAQADTFLHALADRQRQNAYPEVVSNVAHWMATQIVQDDVHKRSGTSNSLLVEKDNPIGSVASQITDVARLVTEHVESNGGLRRAVRLTEVSTTLDHRQQRGSDPAKSHPDVKTLVKANNTKAVALDLSEAPLETNRVDPDGANQHLKELVRNGDHAGIRSARENNAIDFGGRVQRTAPRGPVLDAFLPPDKSSSKRSKLVRTARMTTIPKPARTPAQTTTNTTTTTTTTTTGTVSTTPTTPSQVRPTTRPRKDPDSNGS
ncbi:hypothetical protein F9K07_11860 [Hydrogenophaga sp. BPS33]|nr:hypothetical protein F9K07_11860 [Hydrogenophaga sp. BPS33]